MKAAYYNSYGAADVVVYGEAPDPIPGDGEYLIRVRAIGVNPADGKWRSGMFAQVAPLPLPHIGGYDVAGEIVSGPELAPGTRVAAMVDHFRAGAYAELTLADPGRIAVLPDSVDFATAAGVPTPALTGIQAIEEQLAIQPGQRVLVTGALGAVGRFALAAAKRSGATVIAAVRPGAEDEARAIGADEVVLLDGSAYHGAAFDRIADTVGGAVVAPLCQRIAPGGVIRTVATTPIPTDGVPVEIVFFGLHPDAAQLARALDWIATGLVEMPVADRLPLSSAGEAQARLEAGGVGGKLILEP